MNTTIQDVPPEVRRACAHDLLLRIKSAMDVTNAKTVEEVHWLLDGMIAAATDDRPASMFRTPGFDTEDPDLASSSGVSA